MKIIGIEHIGIAVNSLIEDSPFWKHVLKIPAAGKQEVPQQGVITDIYDTGQGKIELLEALDADSIIKKFIDKRGSGVHHVCFEVEDITEAIKELKNNNIQIINDSPSLGAEGFLVIFIHPRSTGGVLVELAQKP